MTEKEKIQYELHTSALINKEQLEKDVAAGNITRNTAEYYLSRYIWEFQYPDRDKADEIVLAFINNVACYHHADLMKQSAVYELFSSGYCFYFAVMLREAFQRGEVCWCAPYGHICWVDNNGLAYDIYGICDAPADYFIPVSYIKDGLADFKHVPGEAFDASEEYIQDAIQRFERDLRNSAGVQFSWEEEFSENEKRILTEIQKIKDSRRDSAVIFLNENYSVKISVMPTIDTDMIQIGLTLCDKDRHYLLTTTSAYEDDDKLKININLILKYMDRQDEKICAAVHASNIFHYFKNMFVIYPLECSIPGLDEKHVFIMITSDKAEYTGEDEDVLSFELRGDSEVLAKKVIEEKDVSEKTIAEKLLELRHTSREVLKGILLS